MARNIYSKKQTWKFLLFIFALLIGASSLWYTNNLIAKLSYEEHKKVELWAEATKQLGSAIEENVDINFLVRIIQGNETVPVILTDQRDTIISYRNLDTSRVYNSNYLKSKLAEMKSQHAPIEIDLGDGIQNHIYYKDSLILTKLALFPYIQFAVVLLFAFIAYFAFSVSRKAEQNEVWIGLTKETAHQLGTPTSSLMAWVELMRMKNVDAEITNEVERDVQRLKKITERFSKIGSKPTLRPGSVKEIVVSVQKYLQSRMPDKVIVNMHLPEEDIYAPINASLFEWVIENVMKNAYDAIVGGGQIDVSMRLQKNKVVIDIKDTGKGIPKARHRTIFKPGYTTKQLGWGLGLSLSKRIVENNHGGKIFVSTSEIGKGTNIRIILNAIV